MSGNYRDHPAWTWHGNGGFGGPTVDSDYQWAVSSPGYVQLYNPDTGEFIGNEFPESTVREMGFAIAPTTYPPPSRNPDQYTYAAIMSGSLPSLLRSGYQPPGGFGAYLRSTGQLQIQQYGPEQPFTNNFTTPDQSGLYPRQHQTQHDGSSSCAAPPPPDNSLPVHGGDIAVPPTQDLVAPPTGNGATGQLPLTSTGPLPPSDQQRDNQHWNGEMEGSYNNNNNNNNNWEQNTANDANLQERDASLDENKIMGKVLRIQKGQATQSDTQGICGPPSPPFGRRELSRYVWEQVAYHQGYTLRENANWVRIASELASIYGVAVTTLQCRHEYARMKAIVDVHGAGSQYRYCTG